MAFPTTPVLDNFSTGASEALSARSGWSASHIGGYGDFVTDSVPTKAVAAANADNLWGATYTNTEVYATIVDWAAIAGNWKVVGRYSAGNFYSLNVFSGAWHVQRWDAGVATVDMANGALSPAAGDSFGLSCVGSTITGYYKVGAGGWTLLGGGIDTLWKSGLIGAQSEGGNPNNSFDDFGGGEVVSSGPRQQTVPFTRGAGGGGKI